MVHFLDSDHVLQVSSEYLQKTTQLKIRLLEQRQNLFSSHVPIYIYEYLCQLFIFTKQKVIEKNLYNYNIFQLITTKSHLSMTLKNNPFKSIVGKGENAGNQHFRFSQNVFYLFQKEVLFLS